MLRSDSNAVCVTVTLSSVFAWILLISTADASSGRLCPIGFNTALLNNKDTLCYRLKPPEKFEDKFEECTGNLYTLDLLRKLTTVPEQTVWSDHKTLYPGGVFVDTSYSNTTGGIFNPKVSEKAYSNLNLDQELCTLWSPNRYGGEVQLARCDDKHYRYCIVPPYTPGFQSSAGCSQGHFRFYSPTATCLSVLDGVGGGTVRATWRQAQTMCNVRNGTLLQRGWRQANALQVENYVTGSVPLSIFKGSLGKLFWAEPDDDEAEIPNSEWSFTQNIQEENSLVALDGDNWTLVNDTAMFYNVICEKPVNLPELGLYVTETEFGELILQTSALASDNIHPLCFTDSYIPFAEIYSETNLNSYDIRINITRKAEYNQFSLIPKYDGYYWCINTDSINYDITESNRHLYIREEESVKQLYAIKFKRKETFPMKKLSIFLKIWTKKLAEFTFLRTNYLKVYGNFSVTDSYAIQRALKRFKDEKVGVFEDDKVFRHSIYRRTYWDRKTVLIHVELNSDMEPLMPGNWEELEVVFMRPAYYCRALESIPSLALGQSVTIHKCKTYTCVGDFNEGVQLVETLSVDCVLDSTTGTVMQKVEVAVDDTMPTEPTSTVEYNDTTTTAIPTELPIPVEYNRDSSSSSSSEESESTTEATRTSEVVSTATLPAVTTVQPLPTTIDTTTDMTTTMTTESDTTTTTMTTCEETTETLPSQTPSPRPPQDHVNDVMDHLEDILLQDIIHVQDIKGAFDEIDELLSIKEAMEIPGNFLTMMDELGARADLNGSWQVATVRRNVAMVVADARPGEPVRGLRIASRADDAFQEDAFHILTEERNETHLETDESEAVVYLPESVAQSDRRISFVVFRDDRPFLPARGYQHYDVNSRILSIKIQDLTQFENGDVIDIHLRPIDGDIQRNQSRSCGYWHFLENGTGKWSQDGCEFIPTTIVGMLDTCRCTHLTHFAEVLVPRALFSEANERALEIISIVGCCFSVFGLLIIGLTAILFRSWRRDFNNKIWLNLCAAIFLLVLSFLIVAFADFQAHNLLCMFTGIALHYAVICSFCWMLVAAIISYRRLVLVFTRDASHKLFRACAFAYGTPFAIFGILLSVDPHAYGSQFEEKMSAGAFCYPSGLAIWITVYAPVAVMLLANCTLFGLIVRSVFATKHIQRHGDANEALRCASVSCLLVFLFGLPWIFGLFSNSLVFAYLFTLTATLQGFVLFFFFVIGNKKTRELWLNKLRIKQSRKVIVTSSTGYRGGNNTITIEANSSKPRSLAGTDESRFS